MLAFSPGFGLRVKRFACAGVWACAAWIVANVYTYRAQAQSATDYDSVLDKAVEAFEAKDYAHARAWFERAYALQPNARVLRGMGISALHLEQFTVAKRELTAALEDARQPLTASQREGVTELLSWMSANLGTLRLDIQPANARVAVDGEVAAETEFLLAPGS
ncbi:MAG TPA: hypothetical protein VJR89_38690, partial [Polyangiales bacterium]|nr:hypothetical protein [Polyangiales bacterium]